MKHLSRIISIIFLLCPIAVFAQEYHTIYEIQGQSSNSPFDGQIVKTRGIVTAVFDRSFFIEERPGGAWRGIYVWINGTPSVSVGDSVEVTGEIDEYYNTTEFTNNPTVTVLTSGLSLPDPVDTTTGELGQEAYEGVYAVIRNVVATDTSSFGQYDEWYVNDGSGDLMIDYTLMIEVQGGYGYLPVPGDTITEIRGIAHYSYYHYKLVPRENADILLMPVKTELILSPERAFSGEEVEVELFLNLPEQDHDSLKALRVSIDSSLNWDLNSLSLSGDGTEGAIVTITDTLISIDSLAVTDSMIVDFGGQTMPPNTGSFDFPIEVSFNGITFYDIKPKPTIETIAAPDGLYDIRTIQGDGYTSPFTDSGYVWIQGTITTPNFSDDGYTGYIQDSTGGINIFSYDPLGLHYGYRYLLWGQIEEYNGITEFKPESDSIILFSKRNNPVEVETLGVSVGLSEEREGKLITIKDVIVIEPPTVPSGGGYNCSVRNGQTALALRIISSTGIVSSLSLDKYSRWNITGVVGQYDSEEPYTSGYQLLPRFISDFTAGEVPSDTTKFELSIDPNPFAPDQGQVTWITVSCPKNYRINGWIYDAKGREIKQIISNHPGPIKTDWMGTDNLSRRVNIGTYILHIEAVSPLGKITSITQPIVVATELGGS